MISKTSQDSLAAKASAAFECAADDVIARARVANTEVVIWRDGEVTKLSPDQAEREWQQKKL